MCPQQNWADTIALVNTHVAVTKIGSLRSLKLSAVELFLSPAKKQYLAIFHEVGIDGQAAILSRAPH